MKQDYRRWAWCFLAFLLTLLVLCAGTVYIVDPCLYYRMPTHWQPVFFNERYQSAGMVKHVPADTVLLGTSMTANYRAGWIEESYRTSGLRITIPDGHFSEFDQIVDLLYREYPPKRVLFALDLNILIRDDSSAANAMPGYLYNQTPLDDIKYLLNKDCLYYSFYTLLTNRQGGGQTLDEGFTWDSVTPWGKHEVLMNYERPPAAKESIPEDAYLESTDKNLAVMERWFQAHPDTKFEIFLSPYSILFWDHCIRQGELDARFTALERTCEVLMRYDNTRLHAPLFAENMITTLNNYCDYIHHSGEAGKWVLGNVCGEKFLLRPETVKETLAQWREFVVNYDYDSLWDQEFWDRWYETHDGPPSWYEG